MSYALSALGLFVLAAILAACFLLNVDPDMRWMYAVVAAACFLVAIHSAVRAHRGDKW